jgi:putative phage-type endonuclease
MLINQDFSVDRTKYIGGSDIGAILGLSRFKTPLEVWMEKTGKETKKVDSLPLRFGSFAEDFVAREYSRATGFELLHDESIYLHPEHSYMSAHIDRFVLGAQGALRPNRILECKTANPFSSGDWGEIGSDEVPMGYLCQCIWYMAITAIDKTDLAVLFGNSDFRIYEIARDPALEALVIAKAATFWDEHVLKDIPPPASNEQDCQTLFSKGDPAKSIEAGQETLELTKRLQLLNSEIDVREEEISSIKQNIMSQMGEAELLTYQGRTLASWKAPKPSFRLDSKTLELDHPEIASNYKVPVQNSRRLVIKELKNNEGDA